MKYKTLLNNSANESINVCNIRPPISTLFYRGHIPDQPRIGIIGSRRPSSYGIEVAESLSSAASSAGISVVSGLAIGIDAIAHKGALETDGHTIAVVPGSLSKTYPARHHRLASRILTSGGAIISEAPYQEAIRKHDFIKRNRIIAGLSDVLLVVEASQKSGTMHTVNFMLEAGKPVAAVPGAITSPASKGTNWLLKNGAHLIDSIDELLSFFPGTEHEARTLNHPSTTHQQVLTYLKDAPATAYQISRGTNQAIDRVNEAVCDLEIDGYVAKNADGMYALRLGDET